MGFGKRKKGTYILDEDDVCGGNDRDYAAEDGDRTGKETPLSIDHLLPQILSFRFLLSRMKWNQQYNSAYISPKYKKIFSRHPITSSCTPIILKWHLLTLGKSDFQIIYFKNIQNNFFKIYKTLFSTEPHFFGTHEIEIHSRISFMEHNF